MDYDTWKTTEPCPGCGTTGRCGCQEQHELEEEAEYDRLHAEMTDAHPDAEVGWPRATWPDHIVVVGVHVKGKGWRVRATDTRTRGAITLTGEDLQSTAECAVRLLTGKGG